MLSSRVQTCFRIFPSRVSCADQIAITVKNKSGPWCKYANATSFLSMSYLKNLSRANFKNLSAKAFHSRNKEIQPCSLSDWKLRTNAASRKTWKKSQIKCLRKSVTDDRSKPCHVHCSKGSDVWIHWPALQFFLGLSERKIFVRVNSTFSHFYSKRILNRTINNIALIIWRNIVFKSIVAIWTNVIWLSSSDSFFESSQIFFL